MNDGVLKRLANQATNLGPHPDPRFPPSKYYKFLELLNNYMVANLAIELGVCGGGGSLHLALGNPKGTVIGVDYQKGEWWANIEFLLDNYSNFEFWLGDSISSVGKICEKFGKPKILFIDTIHTFERTLQEFNAWRPYMEDGFVICLDDLHRREMGNIFDVLPGKKLRLDFLHDGSNEGGFGVIYE